MNIEPLKLHPIKLGPMINLKQHKCWSFGFRAEILGLGLGLGLSVGVEFGDKGLEFRV